MQMQRNDGMGRSLDDGSEGVDLNDRRIRELQRQLAETRDNNRNDVDDDRIQELERRLSERISELRDGDDDEDAETRQLRREMIRDMAEYQSEMMEEIRKLQRELFEANSKLVGREQGIDIDDLDEAERARLIAQRRAERLEAARQNNQIAPDSAGTVEIPEGATQLEDISVNTGGVYLADGNAEGFTSNITYTGMSGTVGFNFGDATGLGLGLRWHYKLGPDQRAEFMPEAYFGIGSPTTFGIFGNIVYPLLTERSQSTGLIPYAGVGIGAMQIQDSDNDDETNFRPAINLLIGTYLPVGNGRVFADFSTRNFFSVNQLTGGYRFNF
jgi:hypothetical protein